MMTPGNDEKGLAYGVTPKERRRSARAKIAPNEILYMNFQSGNGGVVLDVSSTGLGFQVAEPMERSQSLSFRFSAPAIEHFEISGQLVWLDKTRKRGGLRLSDLPVEVRREMQLWRRRHLPPAPDGEPAGATTATPVSPKESPVQSRAILEAPVEADRGTGPSFLKQQHVLKPPAQAQDNPAVARTPFASALGLGLNADAPQSSVREPSPAQPSPIRPSESYYTALSTPEESRWSRHLFTASLIVALILVILAVGFFYFGNKRRAGELLIRWGQSISGEQSQQSAQVPAAAVAEAPTTSPAVAAARKDPGTVGGQPLGDAAERPQIGVDESHPSRAASGAAEDSGTQVSKEERPSPVQPETEDVPKSTGRRGAASAPADNGEDELARARQYLEGTSRADRAMAAQLLWEAVGKGSSDAEVELADLYLEGQGSVPKNCQQAVILLRAAQNNHNPEAAQRLGHLRSYGCR